MKKAVMLALVLAAVLFLFSQNAFAFTWNYSGLSTNSDISGTVETGLTLGAANVGSAQGATQPIQISGAGTDLGTGNSGVTLEMHFNGSSWDSYSAYTVPGTGYYDVIGAVLSKSGYYWQLTDTSTHPLETNGLLVLGAPVSGTGYSYTGGVSSDGLTLAATFNDDVALNFVTDPTKHYYLSIFLQTMGTDRLPTWGTISNVVVEPNPVPEPASLSLLGLGLLGLIGMGKKRKA